jgi:hypothetical protein
VNENQTITCCSEHESLITIESDTVNPSSVSIMILDRHSLCVVLIQNELNVSIIVTNGHDFSTFLVGALHQGDFEVLADLDGFERSWLVNVADVHETIELAFGGYNELLVSILGDVRHD